MSALAVKEGLTQRYINERPVTAVGTRHTRTANGSGGYTSTSTNLPAKTFRMVPNTGARSGAPVSMMVSGSVVTPDWILVFMPSEVVKRGDRYPAAINGDNVMLHVEYVSTIPEDRVIAYAKEQA